MTYALLTAPHTDRSQTNSRVARRTASTREVLSAERWLDAIKRAVPNSPEHLDILQQFSSLSPAEQQSAIDGLQRIQQPWSIPLPTRKEMDRLDMQKRMKDNEEVIDASGLIDTRSGHRARRVVREGKVMGSDIVAGGVLSMTGNLQLAEAISAITGAMLKHRMARRSVGPIGPLSPPVPDEAPKPSSLDKASNPTSLDEAPKAKPLSLERGPYSLYPAQSTPPTPTGRRPLERSLVTQNEWERDSLKRSNDRLQKSQQPDQKRILTEARARDGVEAIPRATDRAIMAKARDEYRKELSYIAEVKANNPGLKVPDIDQFINEVLTRSVIDVMAKKIGPEKAQHLKSGLIGFYNGRPVYGSAMTGVGLVKLDGTWFVVQMKNASAQMPSRASEGEIYGKFN